MSFVLSLQFSLFFNFNRNGSSMLEKEQRINRLGISIPFAFGVL